MKIAHYQAYFSIILGIMSINLLILLYVSRAPSWMAQTHGWNVLFTGVGLISGIILGRRGLKYYRKIAISGIVVCGLGLLFWLYYFLVWFGFVMY
jgi:hypothetical protein